MSASSENQEYGQNPVRDWETEVRQAFQESLESSDPVVRALAQEVLKMNRLNEFCFVISPKIVKHLLESPNPVLKDVTYRLWSSQEEGHVCVFAIDKARKKLFVVEAAGLLSNKDGNDSDLGIHELDSNEAYRLFGNPDREQFISPEYTTAENFVIDPQTEKEMNSQRLHYLSGLV